MTLREWLQAMYENSVFFVHIRLGITTMFKSGLEALKVLEGTSVNLDLEGDLQFGETTYVTLNDQFMAWRNHGFQEVVSSGS